MKKYLIGIIGLLMIFGATQVQAGFFTDLKNWFYPQEQTEQTMGAGSFLYPYQGGTGTSTKPSYGQMLIGTSAGVYQLTSTSTLGITASVPDPLSLTKLTATFASSTAISASYASSTLYYGANLANCTGKLLWSGGQFSCGTDSMGGVGTISTSTSPTQGGLSYWTSSGAWPETLGTVATTTLTASSPLSLSNAISVIGSATSALTCTTAASGVAGCLSNTAFDTFNNKQATISATYPIILTGATLSFPATSTLYGTGSYGNFLMWNGSPTWTATSTLSLTKSQISDFGTYQAPITDGTNLTFTGNTLNVDDPFTITKGNITNASTTQLTTTGSTYLATTGGNVGIGTTSPFANLSVAGNGFFNGNLTASNITATGTLSVTGLTTLINASTTKLDVSGTGAYMVVNAASSTITNLQMTNGNATTTSLYVSALTNLMGNVGIGTTSPYSLLSISNSRTTTANTPLLTIASTTDGTATSTFLTVLANGYVGIGTTGPGGLLDVRGRFSMFGSTQGYLYFDENEMNSGYNTNAEFTSYINWNGYQAGTSQFRNLNIANGKEVSIMYFQGSTGNVGIGTTSPFAKLSVAGGNVFINQNLTASNITATGTLNVTEKTTLVFASTTGTTATTLDTTNFYLGTNGQLTSFLNGGLSINGGVLTVNGTSTLPQLSITASQVSDFKATWDSNWNASTTLASVTTLTNLTTASSTNYYGGLLVPCTGATNALRWSAGSFSCGVVSVANAASSTLLGDGNNFTGINIFSNASSDWQGLFSGQLASYYLNFANLTGTGTSTLPNLLSIGTTTGTLYLNAGQMVATTSLSRNYLGLETETLATFNIGSSTMSTTTGSFLQKKIATAATITGVACDTDKGTSTIQCDIRNAATPNTAGTNVLGGTGLQCDSGTNQVASTTLASTAITAFQNINCTISDASPVGGTKPTIIHIFLYGTKR